MVAGRFGPKTFRTQKKIDVSDQSRFGPKTFRTKGRFGPKTFPTLLRGRPYKKKSAVTEINLYKKLVDFLLMKQYNYRVSRL